MYTHLYEDNMLIIFNLLKVNSAWQLSVCSFCSSSSLPAGRMEFTFPAVCLSLLCCVGRPMDGSLRPYLCSKYSLAELSDAL